MNIEVTLQQHGDTINGLGESMKRVEDTVNRIEVVLIGDKFDKTGLIQGVGCNKKKIRSLEKTREKNKWTIGVAITIATVCGTIIGLIIKLTDLL